MVCEKVMDELTVFPLLREPAGYRPCSTDLLTDAAAREHWLGQFRALWPMQIDAARSIGVDEDSCLAARDRFLRELDAIEQNPARHGRLDILLLDEIRRAALTDHGIYNEFRAVKARENETTLPMLGGWLERLDGLEQRARIELLLRGMLAGNLFDMGAVHTAAEFTGKTISFDDALARVPGRPWFRDGVDEFMARWQQRAWRKVIVFADNAGADATLGLLPLARELLRSGAEVVLTANAQPTWNDITIDELRSLVQQASDIDSVFSSDSLTLVTNGTSTPLIDLRKVSRELVDCSRDADLVVLIGMGRGVESNWLTRFTCDCLGVAMLKDPHTAGAVGGTLFDAVVRFDKG